MARPRLTDEERKARVKAKNARYYEANKSKWKEVYRPASPDSIQKARVFFSKLTDQERQTLLEHLVPEDD